MPYKALTYVNLPPDNRKAPGDKITDKELKEAGQTKEDIDSLVKSGSIGDEDAELHQDHAPVEIVPSSNPLSIDVVTGEMVEGSETTNES
jgi:hypothetical protein